MNTVAELMAKNQQLETENTLLRAEKFSSELERQTLQQEKEGLEEACIKLTFLIETLNRILYGTKSEKYHAPDLMQEPLFSDLMTSNTEVEQAPDSVNPEEALSKPDSVSAKKPKRKSPVSKSDQAKNNPNVETVEVIIPVSEADKIDKDGNPKHRIGFEEKEMFHLLPARILIVIQKREIWASSNGDGDELITAPLHPHVLGKCGVTPAFLADSFVTKMVDRQPWYHQSVNLLRRYGITITRGTLAKWAIQFAEACDPLVDLIRQHILSYPYMRLDATWFNVLKSEKGPGKRPCIWGFSGGPPGQEAVLFGYQEDEFKKDYLLTIMGRYEGVAMCDGDPAYYELIEEIGWLLAACNSHARRKFEDLLIKCENPGLVHQIMSLYTDIYKLEAKAKALKLNQTEHTVWRDQKMRPVFNELHQLLLAKIGETGTKSAIGKAITYTLKYWKNLTRCLDDSRIDLDNNEMEREIRKFVLGRNNFLFADTPGGAHALGTHFTLILSARSQGINERNYLELLIKELSKCDPKNPADYIPLLPWNVDKNYLNSKLPSPTGWD
jgi:transposase